MPLWKDYYTYIVECADGSYYVGVTNALEKRIDQHNEGKNKAAYTYKRRPVILRYSAHFHDIWEAIACEKRWKKWSHKKKEALIEQDWQSLQLLSECKNFSHFKIDSIRKNTKSSVMVRLRSPRH